MYFPVPVRDFDGQAQDGDAIVGPAYMMMSSALSSEEQGITEDDWEIALPAQNAVAALTEAKALFKKHKLYFPLVGIFLRFGRVEDGVWMASAAAGGAFQAGDPMMYFEMVFFAPPGADATQQAVSRQPFKEIAEVLINRFGGRPHWGKSRQEIAHLESVANGGMGNYGPDNRAQFQKVAAKYDPLRLFENSFALDTGLLGP